MTKTVFFVHWGGYLKGTDFASAVGSSKCLKRRKKVIFSMVRANRNG